LRSVYETPQPISGRSNQCSAIQDDVNWDTPHEISKSSLALKRFHKARLFERTQKVRPDASAQIDGAGSHDLQRQIAGLTREDRKGSFSGRGVRGISFPRLGASEAKIGSRCLTTSGSPPIIMQ